MTESSVAAIRPDASAVANDLRFHDLVVEALELSDTARDLQGH
jgi:hypothetical protein